MTTYANDPISQDKDGQFGNNPSAGLTKREYFAAMAMHGFCANSFYAEKMDTNKTSNDDRLIAKVSVQYADALINALNEGENE